MRSTWVVALALAGCGGESLTALEGLYAVSTWTLNPDSCDADGPSIAETHDGFAYLKAESFLGTEFVNVHTCATADECADKARDGDTIHLNAFTFEEGSDADGWTNTSAFGFMRDVSCESLVSVTTLTAPAAGTIRIEQRTLQPATYPPENGACTEEGAEAAGGAQPCAELEVVTMTKTGDL